MDGKQMNRVIGNRLHTLPLNWISLSFIGLVSVLVSCGETSRRGNAGGALASEAVNQELATTRPAFAELPTSEQAVVYLWLHADCAVGQEERRASLVSGGNRLELAFIEAFRMGPPKAFLGEITAIRREEYIAIQDGLKEPDGLPLDASIRKRLTTTTEESYVAEGLALTIRNYRLAALEGLKLVGSQKALAWLDRTVPTLQDAELARAAKATIDVLRGRHAG